MVRLIKYYYGWMLLVVFLAAGGGKYYLHKHRPEGDLVLILIYTRTGDPVARGDINENSDDLKIDGKNPEKPAAGKTRLVYEEIKVGLVSDILKFEKFDEINLFTENITIRPYHELEGEGNEETITLYPRPRPLEIKNSLTISEITVEEITSISPNPSSIRIGKDKNGTINHSHSKTIPEAIRFGSNTIRLKRKGYRILEMDVDDSVGWTDGTPVKLEIVNDDFNGIEEKASLGITFDPPLLFDGDKYQNIGKFLNDELIKQIEANQTISLSHQDESGSWSPLTSKVHYRIKAATNNIMFSNVHIGPKGVVKVIINNTNYLSITKLFKDLKDSSNTNQTAQLIAKKATLTIEPNFTNWLPENDYKGFKIEPPQGVTNNAIGKFVYKLDPFKEHKFTITGEGLKTSELKVDDLIPAEPRTVEPKIELEDEKHKSWNDIKNQISQEALKDAPLPVQAHYNKIVLISKTNICQAIKEGNDFVDRRADWIAKNRLDARKDAFKNKFFIGQPNYKRYFEKFERDWKKEVVDPFNETPEGDEGVKYLDNLDMKTVHTFDLASVKFKKEIAEEKKIFKQFRADHDEYTRLYKLTDYLAFENKWEVLGDLNATKDPLQYSDDFNASRMLYKTAYHDALKREYKAHPINIQTLKRKYGAVTFDKTPFPSARVKNDFDESITDPKGLEQFHKDLFRNEYKKQYTNTITKATHYIKDQVDKNRKLIKENVNVLLLDIDAQIMLILADVELIDPIKDDVLHPEPPVYHKCLNLLDLYEKLIADLNNELQMKIPAAIVAGKTGEAWRWHKAFQKAFPNEKIPWLNHLKCKITQEITTGSKANSFQIYIPLTAENPKLFIHNQWLDEELILPLGTKKVRLVYMMGGSLVEYEGPELKIIDQPTITIQLNKKSNVTRPSVVEGMSRPFRRVKVPGLLPGGVPGGIKSEKGERYVEIIIPNGTHHKDLDHNDFVRFTFENGERYGGYPKKMGADRKTPEGTVYKIILYEPKEGKIDGKLFQDKFHAEFAIPTEEELTLPEIRNYDPASILYFIDAGANRGIKVGDKFAVFHDGKEVGNIEIVRTLLTVSIAVYQKGFPEPSTPFRSGDQLIKK